MKKIFTICFAALMSAAMWSAETVVWTGEKAISWNQEVYAGEQFDTYDVNHDLFAGVKKDDTIKVTVVAKIDEPQYVITYKAGTDWGWTDLENVEIGEGVVIYAIESDQIAEEIAGRGLVFRGQGYDMTQIAIVTADSEGGEPEQGVTLVEGDTVTLFEDETGVVMSWNEICEQDAALGAQLAEKDQIIVIVSAKDAACEWPKVILRDASSEEVANVLLNEVEFFPTEVVFELSADGVAAVQEGFRISGDGVTITKVQVYKYKEEEPGEGPEPLLPGEERVLWEGSETLAWNEVAEQPAEVGALLGENDQLIVTVSEKGAAEWPKVLLRDASSNQVGEDVLLDKIDEFPFDVIFTLTAEDVEALAGGFKVCGDGVTVTKLVLKKYNEDEEEEEIDYTGLVETVVFEPESPIAISWDNEAWAGVKLDTRDVSETMFAGLQEGHIIRVSIVDDEELSEYSLQYKAGDDWTWTGLPVEVDAEGNIAYVVESDEMAMLIADRGLVVQGIRYKVSKISVFGAEALPSAVETVSGEQVVMSGRYNVLGQKVDESYKGIVIMNGKKYFQ